MGVRASRSARVGAAILASLVLAIAAVSCGVRGGAGFDAASPSTTVATTTTAPSGPLTDAELVAEVSGAVWRVEVSGCGVEGGGTAWAIDDRHLVTNAHVVNIDPSPTLVSRSGERRSGEVIGMKGDPDLAVIRVGEDLPQFLAWADTDDLQEGERVVGFGYPAPAGDFAVAPGTAVSFQTERGERIAVRTDAALDRGNSGGPLVTEDGAVAGLITEMQDADTFQLVPLAFTAAHLGDGVTGMIDAPAVVERDCELFDEGPPVDPDVPSPPPPPTSPPPVVDLPEEPAYEPPAYEPPTTTTVPCPTGRPSVTVTSVEAVQDMPDYLPESWTVTIRGTIANDASASIYTGTVDVSIGGTSSLAFPDSFELRPGATSTFSTTAWIDSAGRPGNATAVMNGWSWSDWDVSDCGTG